jgi:hypothetical protein
MVDQLKCEIEAGGVQPTITTLEEAFDKLRDVMP